MSDDFRFKQWSSSGSPTWWAKDEDYWYFVHQFDEDEWVLDVFTLTHGDPGEHAYDVDSKQRFERTNRGEIFRLARSIHDFSPAKERLYAA